MCNFENSDLLGGYGVQQSLELLFLKYSQIAQTIIQIFTNIRTYIRLSEYTLAM